MSNINIIPVINSLRELKTLIVPPYIDKPTSQKMEHVAITGASGFFALYLIDTLVRDNKVKKITCFIRNKEKFIQNKDKLKLSFNEDKLYFIEDASYSFFDNIENIKYLDTITQFIHNAAEVHNLKSCNQLWASNVELTEKILALWAKTKSSGSFHLISTLSVFASSVSSSIEPRKKALEIKEFEDNYQLIGGYAQSKWLSEYLLSKYSQAYIWRLGLLTPSLINCSFRTQEFFPYFLKLLSSIKYLPFTNYEKLIENTKNTTVDISPVNEVASIISIQIAKPFNHINHIANKNTLSLSDIVDLYIKKGKHFNFIDKEEWINYIDSLMIGKINKILLKNAFLRNDFLLKNINYFNIDLFQSSGYIWTEKEMFTNPSEAIIKYIDNLNN